MHKKKASGIVRWETLTPSIEELKRILYESFMYSLNERFFQRFSFSCTLEFEIFSLITMDKDILNHYCVVRTLGIKLMYYWLQWLNMLF